MFMQTTTFGKQTSAIRPIEQADIRRILRMVDEAWRVHIRLSPLELGAKISLLPGFLVEDKIGLRGFMVIEPQHPNAALIMAAGLRDTWNVNSYLGLLLPEVERVAQADDLAALVHIGNGTWLTRGLLDYGFETREWILAFERYDPEPPTPVAEPAAIRAAHYNDLGAILLVDTLAFDRVWRKSVGNFSEALANAEFFIVAELDGQIIGYEWCEIYHRHAHLTRLAVHPDYQGRGIGSQLLRRAIVSALEKGVEVITLNTQENNHRSRKLYEQFGFVFTQQRLPVLSKRLK
jgi:ribosomal-protein-alanine N-acetyltransferase